MRPRLVRSCTRTLAVASAVAALAGCGSDDASADGSGSDTLTVYAASSLTNAFADIGKDFETAHPGVTVRFSFGGSSDLVAQLQAGAPADVFASADTANMDKATSDGLVDGMPVDFASNTLEIAVPPDNPADIRTFADLTATGINLVICAPEVPCGAATQKVAEAAGETLTPVSEEQSVTDVLAKVESGEADAGLVYVTDVQAAGDKVTGIAFPQSQSAINVYPVAALADSSHQQLAKAFVDQVTSTQGQHILREAGFAKP